MTDDTSQPHATVMRAAGSSLRFMRLDLTDHERVLALFSDERFDVVCHLAAQAGVRYSLSDPFAYVSSNVHGFLSILEAARKHPVRHLVYASSSSVYGLEQSLPFTEASAAHRPISLYAASKRSNELVAHSYSHLFGIPTTGLRFFTVYGPWGRPDMTLFKFTRAILSGETIELFNYGDMRRDYTYLDDAADVVVRLTDKSPVVAPRYASSGLTISPVPAKIYNVGHGSPCGLQEVLSALEDELGAKAKVRKVGLQAGDVTAWADCTTLTREVGLRARTPIREAVRRFVAWYRQHYGTKPSVAEERGVFVSGRYLGSVSRGRIPARYVPSTEFGRTSFWWTLSPGTRAMRDRRSVG